MDFSLSEEQVAGRDLAEQIFQHAATVERVKAVEASADRMDRELWRSLADAQLLGLCLPEDVGGSGLGTIELCLLLEQQGRVVAPVPLWPTLSLGALPIARWGSATQREAWLPGVARGETVLTSALAEAGVNDPMRPAVRARRDGDAWRLDGFKPSVPAGVVADQVLVPADTGDGVAVFLVDPAGADVRLERAVTTNRELVAHLTLDGAPAEPLGDPASGPAMLAWMVERAQLGLCAIQLGVCEAALELAATYTSSRLQFGKPLSSFQGAQIKAADGLINTEALRVTTMQAAWLLDAGRPAASEVLVAKWWASEGGQAVVHVTQHLHGGMGADIDYPVHRYFLWGKQIEDTLGGASATLARLGSTLAGATA
jgi:3-oxocholest-4-en-26-oyl-CoA dehydrogenase beta subunit